MSIGWVLIDLFMWYGCLTRGSGKVRCVGIMLEIRDIFRQRSIFVSWVFRSSLWYELSYLKRWASLGLVNRCVHDGPVRILGNRPASVKNLTRRN
ncbi:hypothetical protein CPB83DRAFT_507843 [Crepidotus variabilis]|uniref:Secreted protein n=1 Tax=Crepidotus variabilis TaxID=179855 RepID=A0A9P6JML2_9AGAR|nr:hypothetical protein CPB83DRAFT_507843 [Crepidotus variabilis]